MGGFGARRASGGVRAGGIHIHQHINGGHSSPQEITQLSQRYITESWNHRGADMEPELV